MNPNLIIPPGSTGTRLSPQAYMDNTGGQVKKFGKFINQQMDARTSMAQRFQQPETADSRVNKMREMDDHCKRLLEEFNLLDLNQDGLIQKDELNDFFSDKVSCTPLTLRS